MNKAVSPISMRCHIQNLYRGVSLHCTVIAEGSKAAGYFAIDNGEEGKMCYYFRTTLFVSSASQHQRPVILLYTIGQVRINAIFWCKITH
jgi:hypothetical protein